MKLNAILGTDSYKVTHWPQYQQGTEIITSYLEPRHGAHFPQTLWMGALPYFLPKYLTPITAADVDEAADIFALHFGTTRHFNRAGWDRILHKYDGCLPLRIRALPEGTFINNSVAVLTVENEDDALPWLPNYVETRLSHCWYPLTVASQSFAAYALIRAWLHKTGGDPAETAYKLHDFGYRGVTCEEQAMLGGAAHLAAGFKGTDNLAAVMFARRYYGCTMAGMSVPASEHSTITSWGRDRELYAQRNMLRVYPDGIVASVSDSYDLTDCVERIWGEVLHDEVMSRKGTLVVRPDSGVPRVVVPDVLDILGCKFGYTVNRKGYRVLDPHVRVIQGDGISPVSESIDAILLAAADRGWAAENITFGSGGGLLQNVNRDTQRCAIKCCATRVDGQWRDVYKQPRAGGKTSKGGHLTTWCTSDGTYYSSEERRFVGDVDAMEDVYRDRRLQPVGRTLDEIRASAARALVPLGQSSTTPGPADSE